jgi:hypothetical protein
MPARTMILGLALSSGYGSLAGAWRAPHVDPGNYADVDANVRYAQAAETWATAPSRTSSTR